MRVVAGKYGGHPLKSLSGRVTRPTTDKVKAAVFNMVGPYFDGGKVLDLYAGSGALAIEAVSRGYDFACLVEQNREAQQIIFENISFTKETEKFRLLKMSARQALTQLDRTFDLIFLDPPYAKAQVQEDIERLLAHQLIAPDAKIICETDKELVLPESICTLSKIKEKKYGITRITIYG